MIIVSKDVTDPTITPFIEGDHFVTNPDGSVSIALDAAGSAFAGQEPFQYGVRHDSGPTPGAYQKFTRSGPLLSVATRPGDPIYTYTVIEAVPFP